LHHVKGC